jgi:phage tail-like protein
MTTNTALEIVNQETAVYHQPSQYLKYLPAIYSEDNFMGRFLNIFENILTPVEQTIDQIDLYFDPKLSPEGLLPWLASWVDLVLDEEWPLEKRRQLIGAAVQLYRLRGTRRGLMEYLRIYTGIQPRIVEHYGGIELGEVSQLGWNTVLGEGQGHSFTVFLELEPSSGVSERKIKTIIEAAKPVHVAYGLEIIRKEPGGAGHPQDQ